MHSACSSWQGNQSVVEAAFLLTPKNALIHLNKESTTHGDESQLNIEKGVLGKLNNLKTNSENKQDLLSDDGSQCLGPKKRISHFAVELFRLDLFF